jgi:hypothetical protein
VDAKENGIRSTPISAKSDCAKTVTRRNFVNPPVPVKGTVRRFFRIAIGLKAKLPKVPSGSFVAFR